jgi:hypothetical protein
VRTAMSLTLLLAAAAPAMAQDLGWRGEIELQAGLYFGAFGQSLISSHVLVSHSDSTWEVTGEAGQLWGEFQNSDKSWDLFYRSWKVEGAVDYLPFSTWSPFALGIMEASFQRRIAQRWSTGAGVKWALVRDEGVRFDLSLAILAEDTDFRSDVPIGPGDEKLLARWSARVRARRKIESERWSFESTTLFRPEARDLGRYVLTTSSSLGYELRDGISVELTFADTYDTEGRSRGARSNHEGRFMVGIEATLF